MKQQSKTEPREQKKRKEKKRKQAFVRGRGGFGSRPTCLEKVLWGWGLGSAPTHVVRKGLLLSFNF